VFAQKHQIAATALFPCRGRSTRSPVYPLPQQISETVFPKIVLHLLKKSRAGVSV